MPKATLIISEKPSASEKIAEALTDGYIKKVENKGAFYFEIERNSKKYFVVPAVGHLFGLKQKGKGAGYPRFNVSWYKTFAISKKNEYSRKYFENMEEIANQCDDFIIATDYDQEGSVIGYNIVRYICNRENAKRMKFSTLTTEELNESFDSMAKELDLNLVNSGLSRHYLDWYYGINLSRAFTKSLKTYGSVFNIVSVGRVQAPMLYFLARREREIKQFVSTPFWSLLLKFKLKNKIFEAEYEEKQIWDEKKAESILKSCKNKKAKILEVEKKETEKSPPVPFNLVALQTEAYNLFGYSPKQTGSIAQHLYTHAFISYPRTSSQKLPKALGLNSIIKKLSKMSEYKKFCDLLLKKSSLAPNEGKKSDSAHPAIYPTGEIPKDLTGPQKKLYDLIVRRFLSCFADPAIRESVRIVIDINGNKFKTSGSKTIKKNWIEFYGNLAKFQEVSFPNIEKGEEVNIDDLSKLDKETLPPSRYSQGSILKELEERMIGTKATRADILQILYDRGYIRNKSIEVTNFGMELTSTLEKVCPDIISETLTRQFEKDMELISQGKRNMNKVLEQAQEVVTDILKDIDSRSEILGDNLSKAIIEKRNYEQTLGTCPNCKSDLKIMFSPRTKKRFVGCMGYKDKGCKTGFPIPLKGKLERTDKVCEKCHTPIIYCYRIGKKPFKMCLDPNCETKKTWNKDKNKETKA